MPFTKDCSADIAKLKEALDRADAVLIGAGAGLSTSAGYTYSGKRFHENFHDFEAKYGFHDMYSGGFCNFDSDEEKWAFWSRNIFLNRYVDAPKPVYSQLLQLVKDKNYFVLTTNVDHCFQKAGFDKKRLFYTQGDYGLFQCSLPCRQITYDNFDAVKAMVDEQKDMKIPSRLLPKCPVCGRDLTTNLRVDERFVEDDGWHAAKSRYEQFVSETDGKRVVYLELGVGANTPVIIKYPFWRMAMKNPLATYVCVNFGDAFCPDALRDRSICLDADVGEVLTQLLKTV